MAFSSKSLTPKQLLNDISAGKFKTAYYFYGSEDYRIVEAEKYIAREFLPDKQLMTNYRRFNGRKVSCVEILSELSVYPMLGERQVFGITEFQSYKPTEIERILRLLSPPDPNRLVIFSSPSARAPKWDSAFIKNMAESATVIEFKKLTSVETESVIISRLTKLGYTITRDALDRLLDAVAGNRGALEGELEKLRDFKGDDKTIALDDVRAVTSGFQTYIVYSLADDVIAGKTTAALKNLHYLLLEGSTPTSIVYFLGEHFTNLYLVKNGKSLTSRFAWKAKDYRPQAQSFSNENLEKILIEIASVDSQLRNSPPSAALLLETLAINMISAVNL
ncbi:MAG: DNA polymerase III subunit delta [candidate division Zixibacteria bacterium]|nr:DNA polymerase III subunit delta [candidate division Zixibacteria bacterium]